MISHFEAPLTSEHRSPFSGLGSVQSSKCWYAAYTCAHHEKCVAEQLTLRAVEHFLPLYLSVRQWKDRQVKLQMPLFPGYVFVRLALRDRLQVLEVPSVVRLVSFNGIPAALPETEIEALKTGLEGGIHAEPYPYLKVGRRVRITRGPFEGLEGILIRKRNQLRLVISLDLIQRSILLEVDSASVEPLLGRNLYGERRPRRQISSARPNKPNGEV